MPKASSPGHGGRHVSGHVAGIDHRPDRLLTLWRSTLGKKYVVAVTGVMLALFVIAHMLGNLKAIEGPGNSHPEIDSYARFLRRLGSPVLPHNFALWIERGVLLLALVLHVLVITQLWRRNRDAKPDRTHAKRIRSTFSARSMKLTGFIVLAFIVFHILQFTTRTIHPTKLVAGHVYANAYGAFHKWWIVVIYVGAVALLGLHLNHALWSGAQTVGVDNPDRNWFWRRLATTFAVTVTVGFALIPILFATDALPQPTAPTAAVAHLRARSGMTAGPDAPRMTWRIGHERLARLALLGRVARWHRPARPPTAPTPSVIPQRTVSSQGHL